MVDAFKQKNYKKALELAEVVLDHELTNSGLHLAAANAYKELEETEKANLHRKHTESILNALLRTGDGKSVNTAYCVQSINEEYIIMQHFGYKVPCRHTLSPAEVTTICCQVRKIRQEKRLAFTSILVVFSLDALKATSKRKTDYAAKQNRDHFRCCQQTFNRLGHGTVSAPSRCTSGFYLSGRPSERNVEGLTSEAMPNSLVLPCDVTKQDEVDETFKRVGTEFGRLDFPHPQHCVCPARGARR